MPRIAAAVPCVLVVSAVGFVTFSRPGDAPPPADALIVEDVELGELRVGERRTFTVRIRNTHGRPVDLGTAKVSCGCITRGDAERVVPAHGSVTFPFEIAAPAQPGPVVKSVAFTSAADPDLHWTAAVRGEVVADVWAEPGGLLFTLPHDAGEQAVPPPPRTLTLRWRAGSGPSRWSAGPSLEVREVARDAGSLRLEVRPTPRAVREADRSGGAGRATLAVLSTDGKENTLVIPVRWERKPPLLCRPPVLVVTRDRCGSGEPLTRDVVILRGPGAGDGPLSVSPRVPWARVTRHRRTGTADVVRIELAPDALAAPFTGRLLDLSLPGDPSPVGFDADIAGAG